MPFGKGLRKHHDQRQHDEQREKDHRNRDDDDAEPAAARPQHRAALLETAAAVISVSLSMRGNAQLRPALQAVDREEITNDATSITTAIAVASA